MASMNFISSDLADSIALKVTESGYKQQIILAVYVNIGNLSSEEYHNVISKIQKTFSDNKKQENIIHYIIPVRDQPTRIECIYPHFISSSETLVKDFKESIDNLGDKYHDFFRHMFSFKNELLIEKIK